MTLQKVKTGDALSIPAEFYNSAVDVIKAMRGDTGGFVNEDVLRPQDGVVALVRNDTGSALQANQVLGITGILQNVPTSQVGDFLTNLHLTGTTPDEASQFGRFAVTQQDIPAGSLGECIVDGVVRVKLDVQDTAHLYCKPKDGSVVEMVSDTEGSQILWKEGGTGTGKWALVRISLGGGGGESSFATFQTTATFEATEASVPATKGTVSWPASTPALTEVYNTCGMFFGQETDLCGIAVYNSVNSRWQILQLECVPPSKQEANFNASQGDTISYAATPTPIPFGRQTQASAGDLLTLEADGSYTFNRAPKNGLLDVSFSAVIADILGIGSDGDKSIFQIEYDGGGGYAPIETATSVGHPTFRVPPNDYGMGGTTFGHWSFATTAAAGHKLRMVASTANGNTVSTQFIQSLFKVEEV